MSQKKNTNWAEVRTDTQHETTLQTQNDRVGENRLGYATLTQPTTLQKDWSVMSNPDLPEGWIIAQIGDVAAKALQRVPADDDEFIYVDIGSINRDLKKISEPQKLLGKDAPSRARKVINTGDILVSLTRPNLNAVALVGRELDNQIASTGFEVIKPILVDSRYIFSVVRSNPFIEAISGKVQGALYPAAKSDDVRGYELFLPPLAEQHQIAAKLDELLAQVDSIKTRLDAIPKILKRFRQSVLAAAVSGKLTEQWRISNGLDTKDWNTANVHEPYSHAVVAPNNWMQTTLGKVVDFVGGSQPPKSTFSDTGGADYIRLIQIRDYKSDKHITYIPKSLAKRFCSKTDVMIGRYGPPIFQILRGLEGAYNVALMKAVPKSENLDLEYLFFYLKQDILLKYVEAGSDRTAGQDGVRKELLLPYPFFLPQIDEQTEIVRRVEQLFAYADQIEQRVKDAQTRVNHLTQAILAKAFRGELTADWRAKNPDLISGENSAKALLAKIQIERIATSSKTTKQSKSNDK
jgi:type I restriction enzyme, S subunit